MGVTESTFVSTGFERCITCKPPSTATANTVVNPGELNEYYKYDINNKHNNNNNSNNNYDSNPSSKKKKKKRKKHLKKKHKRKHKKHVKFEAPSLKIDMNDIYGDHIYPSTPNPKNTNKKHKNNDEPGWNEHSRSQSVPENLFANPFDFNMDFHNGPTNFTNTNNDTSNMTYHYPNYSDDIVTQYGFPITYYHRYSNTTTNHLNTAPLHQKKGSILDNEDMVTKIEDLPLTPLDVAIYKVRGDHQKKEINAISQQISMLQSQKLCAINEQKSTTNKYKDDDELSSYTGSVTSPNALIINTPKLKTFSSAPEPGAMNKPIYHMGKSKSENSLQPNNINNNNNIKKHSKKIYFIRIDDSKPGLQKQRSQSMDTLRINQ